MNVYIVSYMNADWQTEHRVYGNKYGAINAFHKLIEDENKYLQGEGIESKFLNESVPEDDYYIAVNPDEKHGGKIEIVKCNMMP